MAVVNGAFFIRGLYFRTFATQNHYNYLEKVALAIPGVAGALPRVKFQYYIHQLSNVYGLSTVNNARRAQNELL